MKNTKLKKIEILIKNPKNSIAITREVFENCWYKIVNNFLIVQTLTLENDSIFKIFNLGDIDSFKTILK